MNKRAENGASLEYGPSKFYKKAKRVIAVFLASITSLSVMMVAGVVIACEVITRRHERPDYALYPGDYCFERVKDCLEREEFFYSSGEVQRKGYYYPAQAGKGLVVISHGYHAGADDYLPITQFFVQNGFNVFAYDGVGTYDSQGEDLIGMCQSLVDLDETLTFLKGNEPYAGQPIFLIGHSWGGYAAASVLELHADVRACACIAPMNSGYTIMQEKGEQYAGKVAVISRPVFNLYQKLIFNDYVQYNGVRGINAANIPVLIAQGLEDKVITPDRQSIAAYKEQIVNSKVIFYEKTGLQGGHNEIWHSIASLEYQNEVALGLENLQAEKGEDLTAEEIVKYYQGVDHTLYSEINGELFAKILEMFHGEL